MIADKGYDSDEIVRLARKRIIVIPPKRNRKVKRYHCKERHRVENAFMKMKEQRGIATRY